MSHSPSFVAGLLSQSLGNKQAKTLVQDAAEALAISGRSWASWDVLAVLDWIGGQGGLTGVAASFAKQRVLLTRDGAQAASMPPPTARSTTKPTTKPKRAGDSFITSHRSLSQDELKNLLAKTVGMAASDKAVTDAMAEVGLAGRMISWDDLHRVLDRIAKTGGTAGASARFIKTRMLLRG